MPDPAEVRFTGVAHWSLLETKMRPPVVHAELVARPHLFAQLDEAAERALTVVSAPTGYGKTTLLSSWAARSAASVAWLTLDASDSDPARLAQYLIASLARAGAPIEAATQRAASAPGADLTGAVLARLLNDLSGRHAPIVLILDDYHLGLDQRCHDLLAALIANRPPALRIVLATRSDPPLPLGRLRARRELLELRQLQLRFDQPEAERFLNEVLALDLDGPSVSALEERTEGWPAGLYLAALSLRASPIRASFVRGFAGSSRHVVDYLGPEMLGPLDAETRTFLLRTSVLERLTGPLCDAVTGMSDSATRLRDLHQDNMFMAALDDDGTWYRYHRLFAELLRSILANEAGERIPELHQRAADWFASKGGLELSVRHALLAGDHERAALEIARGWRQLTAVGRFDTLQGLLDAVGPDRGR